MKFSVLLFLSLFLFSCVPPPSNPVIVDKRFRTTAPSSLYFKNIRSSSYTTTQDPVTRIDYYKLRQWKKQVQSPIIYPIIVHDWMNDAAYIQLQPNGFSGLAKDIIQLKIVDKPHRLDLSKNDFAASTDLAIQIQNAIVADEIISIRTTDSTSLILLEDRLEKNNFLTTLKDFLKLVERR